MQQNANPNKETEEVLASSHATKRSADALESEPKRVKVDASEQEVTTTSEKPVEESKSAEIKRGTGRVKWYDLTKNYGFVTMDGDEKLDLFVHQTSIVNKDHHRGLLNDEEVEFEFSLDAKDGRARCTKCTAKVIVV
jgi:cold shock CspA family protein